MALLTVTTLAACSSEPSAIADSAAAPTDSGITVHGQWVLEQHDVDGSLIARSEFENALLSAGGRSIARFLGREKSPGTWNIMLMSCGGNDNCGLASEPDPCITDTSAPVLCVITEPFATDTQVYHSPNLTVEVPTSGTNANQLVLSGVANITGTGVIDRVITAVRECDPTVAPASPCTVAGGNGITQADLTGDDILNVAPGQSVTVTVVISFS